MNEDFDSKLKSILDIFMALKAKTNPGLNELADHYVFDSLTRWLIGQYLYGFALQSTMEEIGEDIDQINLSDFALRTTERLVEKLADQNLPIGAVLTAKLSLGRLSLLSSRKL